MIPHIARQAKHLYVFQRTANFSLPARNAPLDPEKERQHKAEYPERRRAAYDTPFGIAGLSAACEVGARGDGGGAASRLRGEMGRGRQHQLSLCLQRPAGEQGVQRHGVGVRAREDPRHGQGSRGRRSCCCPNDHPIGTKRLILDTDYYETYNRDNVTLVDIRSAPIKEITPDGLRTADAEYALDAIAFATGFDAMTGAMKEIDIRTDAGLTIEEKWADGPRTYLGIMMAGFPNLFMITGPQSPGVKSQMILSCEQHVDWIADCLAASARQRTARASSRSKPPRMPGCSTPTRWPIGTLYPLANSWYVGANIPGKPRVFMPYVGGVTAYKKKCDEVAAKGYEGFMLAG